MFRRDYIIRLIEAFGQEMRRVQSLKDQENWNEAGLALDEQVKRMIGMDAPAALKLSETELLALLIDGESAQLVREKAWLLTTLLREAGDVAAGQDRIGEADAYYLKALHLLLKALHEEDIFEFPEFVPRVEALVESVSGPLPLETEGLLMEHYERTGQFERAADALDKILRVEGGSAEAIEFGISFYERLQRQSDERLLMGNLPRPKVDAALAALQKRRV